MNIVRKEEFSLSSEERRAIAALLSEGFAVYPDGQTYYKQLPSFRILAWEKDRLAGHLAVEHRLVNNAGEILRIFGVTDLCVVEAFQHRRLASALLAEVEHLGRENGIDFIILMAKDTGIYQTNGYSPQENKCKWLLINNHNILGVANRKLSGLMVKPLGNKIWKEGALDFLGHIF